MMLRSAIAAALFALNAPPQQADYQVCANVNNGPVQRPDHYSTNLHGRRADLA